MPKAKVATPPKGSTTNEPLLAAFDVGNSGTRVKTPTVTADFRSIMGILSKNRMFGEIKSPLVFTLEGETLAFGDDCRDLINGDPIAYTDMSRYTDGFYRKLFAAALWTAFHAMATEGVLYPMIVSSIPVSEFADGKADEVKQLLVGPYVIDGLHSETLHVMIEPENLLILPEGAGSYFQALYYPGSGLATQEVAVLDIGFYTTDLVIFNRGGYVTGSAASAKHGARLVSTEVAQWLRQNHKYAGDVWAVDSALVNGCIQIGPKCVGFADQRDNAYADLLDKIIAFYQSSKGSRTPGVILMSGGVAPEIYRFLPDVLKDEGWRVSSNARGANAAGGLLFLEKRLAAQGA